MRLNTRHAVELKISEKAKRRLEAFEEDEYEVLEFEDDDPSSYCKDLFQYLFGLGKVLIENAKNILPSSGDQDPDTLAFYLLGISKKLPVNKLQDLPSHLGENPNLSSFSTAALDVTKMVSEWFNWLTKLNLNRKGNAPFFPHSENQMISIIARVLLEKYNPATWEVKETWRDCKDEMKKVILIKYLIEILNGHWQGSGDAKMFRSCWRNTTENPRENPTYSLSDDYLIMPDFNYVETNLNAWYSNQMEGKQIKRATPRPDQKIVMK